MKITQLSIKNFKSVEELVIRDIEDVLILVGRNNAGKSVMLDAIRAVSGDYAISEADFHHRDGNILSLIHICSKRNGKNNSFKCSHVDSLTGTKGAIRRLSPKKSKAK